MAVIVPTLNGERTLHACLHSVLTQGYPLQVVCVVDPRSTDASLAIARSTYGIEVLEVLGPPSRKVNHAVALTDTDYFYWLDSDMSMWPGLIQELVRMSDQFGIDAAYIPELIVGSSRTSRIRSFERGFLSGTPVDSLRWFRREAYVRLGGMCESFSDAGGAEGGAEWELDSRFRSAATMLLSSPVGDDDGGISGRLVMEYGFDRPTKLCVVHDDGHMSLQAFLKRKLRYMSGVLAYERLQSQEDKPYTGMLSARYRLFTVFIENGKWRTVTKSPAMAIQAFALRLVIASLYGLYRIWNMALQARW